MAPASWRATTPLDACDAAAALARGGARERRAVAGADRPDRDRPERRVRTLGVPGEELDKVYHRLHDPRDFAGRRALVVGGGDSALETAIALALAGGIVTLSHRGAELTRPKPELVEKLGRLARDPRADVVIERSSSELIAPAAGPFMGSSRGSGALEIRLASRASSGSRSRR